MANESDMKDTFTHTQITLMYTIYLLFTRLFTLIYREKWSRSMSFPGAVPPRFKTVYLP